VTHFAYFDGREVDADSAASLIEGLRRLEPSPPQDLDRYLDLVRSRAALGFGIVVDVGQRGDGLEARCRRAVASLVNLGWLRRVPAKGAAVDEASQYAIGSNG